MVISYKRPYAWTNLVSTLVTVDNINGNGVTANILFRSAWGQATEFTKKIISLQTDTPTVGTNITSGSLKSFTIELFGTATNNPVSIQYVAFFKTQAAANAFNGDFSVIPMPYTANLYSNVGTGSVACTTNLAVQFNATASYNKLILQCPSWSNDLGNLTLSLYKWDTTYIKTLEGSKLATIEYIDYPDTNSGLNLEFSTQNAGEYLLFIENTSANPDELVGCWTSGPFEGTKSYKNGVPIDAAIKMSIMYTSQPGSDYGALTKGAYYLGSQIRSTLVPFKTTGGTLDSTKMLQGLRFCFDVPEIGYVINSNGLTYTVTGYGALVILNPYLTDESMMTVGSTLKGLQQQTDLIDWTQEDKTYKTAYIYNIPEEHKDTMISARAYLVCKDSTDNTVYLYTSIITDSLDNVYNRMDAAGKATLSTEVNSWWLAP